MLGASDFGPNISDLKNKSGDSIGLASIQFWTSGADQSPAIGNLPSALITSRVLVTGFLSRKFKIRLTADSLVATVSVPSSATTVTGLSALASSGSPVSLITASLIGRRL